MGDIDPLKHIPELYYRNLPSILEHGGLYPMTELRQKKIEATAPGRNEWSREADGRKGWTSTFTFAFVVLRNWREYPAILNPSRRDSSSSSLRGGR